jgi:hypothetical protein
VLINALTIVCDTWRVKGKVKLSHYHHAGNKGKRKYSS